MSWTGTSASTGAWGERSRASQWQRFVTLGVFQQGDDVDFRFVATEGGYAVASETGYIIASELTMEQP